MILLSLLERLKKPKTPPRNLKTIIQVNLNRQKLQILQIIRMTADQCLPGSLRVTARLLRGRLRVTLRFLPGRLTVTARCLPGRLPVTARFLPGRLPVTARCLPDRLPGETCPETAAQLYSMSLKRTAIQQL